MATTRQRTTKLTLTLNTIGLVAVASLTLTGVAAANEASLSDNIAHNGPNRLNQILAGQPRTNSESSVVQMSTPSRVFSAAQLEGQINTGDQSVEDVVSILLRVRQQRVGTSN